MALSMKWDMTNEEFVESCREVARAADKQATKQTLNEESIKRSN